MIFDAARLITDARPHIGLPRPFSGCGLALWERDVARIAHQVGFSFSTQAQWRFLNIIHLAHGPESDAVHRDRYAKFRERAPHLLGLIFDALDDFKPDEISAIRDLKGLLDALADDPLREVEALIADGVEPTAPELMCGDLLQDSTDLRFDALRSAFNAWVDRWKVEPLWMADAALQTLVFWQSDAQAQEHRLWTPPSIEIFETTAIHLHAHWTPVSGESIGEYQRRLDREYKELRLRHIEGLKAQAAKEGWPSAPRRFNPSAYLWTAQHQLLGWSMNQVADESGKDKKHVHQSIRALSEMLDFPTTPPRRHR